MSKVNISIVNEDDAEKLRTPVFLLEDRTLYQIYKDDEYFYLLCVENGSTQFGYRTSSIKEMISALPKAKVVDVDINVKIK